MELVEQLRKDGVRKGLCQQYQGLLQGDLSVEELVKLFIGGIDFCIKYNYPTLDFMRDRFKGKSEPYGSFVDDVVQDPLVNVPDLVFNGDCKAMAEYSGFSVSRIFVRHNTQMSVNVSDHAVVTIDAFDNTYLAIAVAGNDAQVIVNLYGDAKVDCMGTGINVINKNKKTY